MLDRISIVLVQAALAITLVGCATASSGPTIPEPENLPSISLQSPFFVEYQEGYGFTCSTWAGTKLWLDNEDFAEALAQTLRNADANVVTDESQATYVLTFGGEGASVDYEIRDRSLDRVVWKTNKSWPHQVSDCTLCCNDHARSHFEWVAEDIAAWDGTPQAGE